MYTSRKEILIKLVDLKLQIWNLSRDLETIDRVDYDDLEYFLVTEAAYGKCCGGVEERFLNWVKDQGTAPDPDSETEEE